MALQITYDRDRKTATINGALGLASVETVTVVSDAAAALAEGTLCLHAPGTDAALAEWDVASGACETDTRASALTAWFAARPGHDCADFRMRLKDADGNLLGAGCCPVVDSCAEGEGSDIQASGGPLEIEAGAEIAAGTPCMIAAGLAQPCGAGDHARFAGIALGHADSGALVRIVRWGAVTIPGWGLAPGAAYWLPQAAGDPLAQAPAGIALCAGTAQDADTLVLTGGRLAVQTADHALLGYAVWDADANRVAVVPAATTGGAPAAGRIVAARADGTLDPAFISPVPLLDALAARFAAVASLLPEASIDAINLKLNQIIAILKGE
ncbi:MAG: hypothetical protein BWX69_03244 [Planctomycetes bacterium ADurb.Bin069]|nr:MAG: hypothetical protein BWX69_03244 [Planctomycetes bacterium ADurb.Bin069]